TFGVGYVGSVGGQYTSTGSGPVSGKDLYCPFM
ncbi:unnamed protein product, partial [marine sediment metagenome]